MSGEAFTTDFPLVEQGYDPNRVDEYVATQMLQLREEVDEARTRIADLEGQLALAKEAEDALQITMVMAKRAHDEMLEKARGEADDIVSEARRAAFSLMTDARADADNAIGEGKAIIAAAREEALGVVTDVEAETARLLAERESALTRVREEYESESTELIDRINTLRAIASDLEAKTTKGPESDSTSTSSPSPTNEGRAATAKQAENVPDREDGDAPNAARIRESFSGRRTAKLPRIGEEAGRSALAAATAMRAHLTNEPGDSDTVEDADLAVRTA